MDAQLRAALNVLEDVFSSIADALHTAAREALAAEARQQFPNAVKAEVTCYLTESYTEHEVRLLDADGNTIVTDWPLDDTDDDFWMLVIERVVGFDERYTVDLR